MSRKIAINVLNNTGEVVLNCNGNSMRPIMSPGESLFIKKVPLSKLRKGDAVFCKVNGGLQVHKINAIDDSREHERFQISNNFGKINSWIGFNNIFGLCVKVEDRVLVSDDELSKRD